MKRTMVLFPVLNLVNRQPITSIQYATDIPGLFYLMLIAIMPAFAGVLGVKNKNLHNSSETLLLILVGVAHADRLKATFWCATTMDCSIPGYICSMKVACIKFFTSE